MYAASGYAAAQGTSFAAPLVAGAAAVLKAVRPGLGAQQYRSLLVGTAATLWLDSGGVAPAPHAGAGLLDLDAALRSTVTTSPVSLSFGADSAEPEAIGTLTVANAGTSRSLLSITAVPADGGPAPSVSSSSLTLDSGASENLTVTLSAAGLAPGVYQGHLRIHDAAAEAEIRVPYWYAVRSAAARYITVLSHALQGAPGQTLPLYLRVTDAAGLTLPSAEPRAAVLSGGAQVLGVSYLDPQYPGVWAVEVQLGAEPGNNVFEIEAGGLRKEVVIEGRAQ
jgi:hypothetical protein